MHENAKSTEHGLMDPKCEYLKISNICWGSISNKSYSKMKKKVVPWGFMWKK